MAIHQTISIRDIPIGSKIAIPTDRFEDGRYMHKFVEFLGIKCLPMFLVDGLPLPLEENKLWGLMKFKDFYYLPHISYYWFDPYYKIN